MPGTTTPSRIPPDLREPIERLARSTAGLARLSRAFQFEPPRYGAFTVAKLDTVYESRFFRARIAPFRGARPPSHDGARRADVWSYPSPLARELCSANAEIELAGETRVGTCEYCSGDKLVTCTRCGGDGAVRSGTRSATMCPDCWGRGRTTCATCAGTGQILHLASVEVVHRLEEGRVVDATSQVPLADVEAVAPEQETVLEGSPVDPQQVHGSGYREQAFGLEPSAVAAIHRLLDEAKPSPGARVVLQRLALRRWRVAEYDYQWRGTHGRLWLVGSSSAPTLVVPDAPFSLSFAGRAKALLFGG